MDHKRTLLPDARVSPRYAGIATFCRYPRLADVAPENRPVDWAIYGVPYDGGVTFRPGARFGPRAIRDESQYVKRYSIEHDVDVCDTLSLADAGDSPIRAFSCKDNAQTVYEFARAIGDPTTKLFAVGGDHSIAYANIKATWDRRGKARGGGGGLPLVHFDSHLDTIDTTMGEKWSHASPFIRAIEDGLIDPKRMISIGIKGPLNKPDDLKFARDHGVTVITYADWQREGPKRIDTFLAALGDREAYLTFDIDCIDPAYAPGTGTPSIGGFTSAEALSLVRGLAGLNLVGADVVEVLPDRDPGGLTALLASHILFEILCLDALRVARASRPVRPISAARGSTPPAPSAAPAPARSRSASSPHPTSRTPAP